MTASDRYYKSTVKELKGFCDKFFENATEVEKNWREKNIPSDIENDVIA